MPQKWVLLSLLVVCITLLMFMLITRGSLCELRLKRGNTEFAVVLAYESGR